MNSRFDILPGGEISDVVPTQLGPKRHQLSKNIRQIRVGEWETVKGMVAIFSPTGATTIKAGIEVDDDLSGDRFLLYQEGTTLKRADYDPTTGYASASPSTLTLPSGITIPSAVTLKFFVYMGVVRITGAVNSSSVGVPLWYGYIKSRTIFPNAWRQVALEGFETGSVGTVSVHAAGSGYSPSDVLFLEYEPDGWACQCTVATVSSGPPGPVATVSISAVGGGYTAGVKATTVSPAGGSGCEIEVLTLIPQDWTGHDATPSIYDCDADGDTSGMWGAPESVHAMKVLQTGATGSARKSWTTVSGKKYRVLLMVFKKSGGTGDPSVKIGKTPGGAEYETLTTTTRGDWVMLESAEFTATGTSLYLDLIPGAGAADAAYFDFVLIEEKNPIVVSGWKLLRAELTGQDIDLETVSGKDVCTIDPTCSAIFAKASLEFDKAQYGVPGEFDVTATTRHLDIDSNVFSEMGYNISYGYYSKMFVDVRIAGAGLAAAFVNDRITGIVVGVGSINQGDPILGDAALYLAKHFDITKDNDPIRAQDTNWYVSKTNATAPNNIYIGLGGTSDEPSVESQMIRIGRRIKISTHDGSLDTVITEATDSNPHFSIAHNVSELGWDTDADTYYKFNVVAYEIEDYWDYDPATGYGVRVPFDAKALPEAELNDYLEIPAGTEEGSPDYDQHVVASDVAVVVSNEDEESDIVRYSPVGQYDNFPELNLVSILAGDSDSVKWIGECNNRLVVLKRKSISQFGWSGDAFSQDVRIASVGLYTGPKGAVSADGVVYFMDQDDLYVFDTNAVRPLMRSQKMRTAYRAGIGTDSFLVWDKLNGELWVHLSNGNILIWHPEMEEWYERTKAFTYLGGFLDTDNRLIMFNASKFLTANHALTTFDETIGYEIKSMLIDGANAERYKIIEKMMVNGMTNKPMYFKIQDPNDARAYLEAESVPPSAIVGTVEKYPDYVFGEAEITVKSVSNSATMYALFRKIIVEVAAWR